MKWFVVSYLGILSICGVFFIGNKKRKYNEKVLLITFCFYNAFFLLGMGFLYHSIYEKRFLLRKEYHNIILTHSYTEEQFATLDTAFLENTKQEVEKLEENILSLESLKTDITKETEKLMAQYIVLSKSSNVSYGTNGILFLIDGFPTFDQRKNYPNGCESIALYLLLQYNGVNVSPDTIVETLKKGEEVHVERDIKYGGDPEIEFVGDPKSKSGYGVYENPIIDVANQFKSGIKKITGTSLSDVLKIVESGKPVQVWASSYQRTPTLCNTWIHKASGKTITWYCNFHSLVLIGATKNKVIVSDPLTGTYVNYDRNKFEYAYDFYGRRAIYYE